ncbi:hypothetical protein FKM82_022286 [Ascaphus truei]
MSKMISGDGRMGHTDIQRWFGQLQIRVNAPETASVFPSPSLCANVIKFSREGIRVLVWCWAGAALVLGWCWAGAGQVMGR